MLDTIVLIFAILPIIAYIAGNIPILETHFIAIVMRHPCQIQKVNIYNKIDSNDCQAILHNGVYLNFNRTDPKESFSSGLFL